MIRRPCWLLVAALASGCSHERTPASAMGPSNLPPTAPPPSSLTPRLWRGAADITTCRPVVGAVCEEAPLDFTLRLSTAGAEVTGTIQLPAGNNQAARYNTVDIGGVAQSDGTLLVTGTGSVPTNTPIDGTLDVQLRLNSPLGSDLSGTIHYTYASLNETTVRDGRILYAREQISIRPGAFEGTWIGGATRTMCTGTCSSVYSYVGNVNLLISNPGSSVSASFNGLRMTGTIVGPLLTLSGGEQTTPDCRARSFNTVYCSDSRRLEVTIDAFERMHGTLTVDTDVFPESGPRQTYTATYALAAVSRWP